MTLFQALTGRLPFLGPDFIAQHLGDTPPLASQVDPRVGAGWDILIASLLAKDLAARPASAGAVGEVIAALDASGRATLSLPRASSVSGPVVVNVVAAPEPPAQSAPRLQAEVPLGTTTISTLTRAVDTALERTVILERFAEGQPDAPTLARLLALAGAGSPHVQRILDWTAATRTMIFEAPAGEPLSARPPSTPRVACRLVAQLASALAALHLAGAAHGQVDAAHVVVDDDGSATLLAAGLGPADTATIAADLAALTSLLVVVELPAFPSAVELRRWAEREDLRLTRSSF